ncbi:hypothetical protein TNCV_212621 [Trichonephila clavipes]|nr:hypothetical protein TNCV_212621 [Trichonephila clavipes]
MHVKSVEAQSRHVRSLKDGVPAIVSSSSLNRGSELRGPLPIAIVQLRNTTLRDHQSVCQYGVFPSPITPSNYFELNRSLNMNS